MTEPTLHRRLYDLSEIHMPSSHILDQYVYCQGCDEIWPCEMAVLLDVIGRLIGTTISGGPVDLD